SFLNPTPPYTAHPSFPTRRSSDLLADHTLEILVRDRRQLGILYGIVVSPRPQLGLVSFPEIQPDALDVVILRRCHSITCNELGEDRKSTRLNSSHQIISYAVFCLK